MNNNSLNIIKYICLCGILSRRDAEKSLLNGEITIDNKIEKSPLRDVIPYKNIICYNNQKIEPIKEFKIFLINKPKNYLVSKIDDRGRKTIYDLIYEKYKPLILNERLIYVGRLDFNSEGLLIMTNYGRIARFFEMPKNKIKRVYELKIFGNPINNLDKILQNGVEIDGIQYGPVKFSILSQKNKQFWVRCEIYEGKNRELRKIFNHFGFLVSHLKRTEYGPFKLTDINKTGIKKIQKEKVIEILKKINID